MWGTASPGSCQDSLTVGFLPYGHIAQQLAQSPVPDPGREETYQSFLDAVLRQYNHIQAF